MQASLLLVLGAAPVAAAENAALQLYEKGDYLAAADAAEAENTGTSLALAARATLADETLRETRCLECLKHAEDFARRAIAADAKAWEGYVELAAALGYQARVIGPVRAEFGGFGVQAKQAIDTALRLAPNDPWALSAAGGWNIEVMRFGGSILGGFLYNASYDEGVAYFRRALSSDPGNLTLSLQYALALTNYDFEKRRLEIMAVLDATARGTPADAYAEAMRVRAAKLIDLLNHDKRDEYRALARTYMGYP